jgi:hypothetical protein
VAAGARGRATGPPKPWAWSSRAGRRASTSCSGGPGHTLLVLDGCGEGDPAALLGRGWGHLREVRGGTPGSAGPDAAVDAGGEVRRRYRGSALHLVRPDGHLAASGREAIAAYLARVYGCPPSP